MRKYLLLLLVLMLLPVARAQSLSDLLLNPEAYDNQRVTVRGEVLGTLRRGQKAWVNIRENEYAIGIWCEAWMIENIRITADYKHKGDVVEVTGVFHRACAEHGGDPDIHAESLTVVEKGSPIARKVNWWLMSLSILLLILSIHLFMRLKRHEEKRAVPYWY